MLGSYRGIIFALVGLALLCGVYGPNKGQAAQRATSDTTEQITEPPAITPSAQEVTRPTPAEYLANPSGDQSYYDREDLKAQRDMAKWTRVMGIAAIIGMALSVVGVWLVWTTFRETRRQAQIAQDALAHSKEMAGVELRPYLHIDEITFQAAETLKGRRSVIVRVRNFGTTPATRFRIEAGIDLRNTVKIDKKKGVGIRRYPSVDEIPPGHSTVISIPGLPQGAFLSEGTAYFCTVRFRYSDKFGAEHTRWETYQADIRGKNEFRFFSHNG